jgi:hypothetical protein
LTGSEETSDSDTDLPQIITDSLLTKQQLPSLHPKARTPFNSQTPSKISDAHSIASSGSFIDDQMTSVPFFSADDRNINFNPSDSEVPQVVPSLHRDDVPYASFYASARDAGIPNVPTALRPSSSATPYGPSVGVDDPNLDFSMLYSFTDSSYNKSRMTSDSGKPPRSSKVVADSFGVSMDVYQSSRLKDKQTCRASSRTCAHEKSSVSRSTRKHFTFTSRSLCQNLMNIQQTKLRKLA